MFRKFVIICAAVAAVIGGAVAIPTSALARGGWGGRGGWGYRGGGYRGGGWGYRGGGWGYRGGFYRGVGIGLGVGALPYYYGGGYPYYGYGGCWRAYTVYTPWGPRLRRVWVC